MDMISMFDSKNPIYNLCIIKPVDGRFDCSFSTNSGKFDHLKIDRFWCILKQYGKNIYNNILYKQIIVIYNVDILPQKNIHVWE